jgi:hypothetical protein
MQSLAMGEVEERAREVMSGDGRDTKGLCGGGERQELDSRLRENGRAERVCCEDWFEGV